MGKVREAQKPIENGKCPMCGGVLFYGNTERQDIYNRHDVVCRGECGWTGYQWDKTTFTGYTQEDEEGEAISIIPAGSTLDKVTLCRVGLLFLESLAPTNHQATKESRSAFRKILENNGELYQEE